MDRHDTHVPAADDDAFVPDLLDPVALGAYDEFDHRHQAQSRGGDGDIGSPIKRDHTDRVPKPSTL